MATHSQKTYRVNQTNSMRYTEIQEDFSRKFSLVTVRRPMDGAHPYRYRSAVLTGFRGRSIERADRYRSILNSLRSWTQARHRLWVRRSDGWSCFRGFHLRFGDEESTVSRTHSPNPPEVHRQIVELVRSELRGPTRVSLPGRCPRSVEGDRRPMNHRGPPGAEPVGTLVLFPSDAAWARTSVLDAKRRQSRPGISTSIPSHATTASNPTPRVHPFAHLIPSIPLSIPLRRAQSAFQPLLRSPSPQARRWTRQWHGETSHDPTSQRNAHS